MSRTRCDRWHCLHFYTVFFLVLIFTKSSSCERRIIDGKEVTSDKLYMVYLSKTNQSTRNYSWICGGAIISDWFVLTSAACIEDEKYTVVIWGYRNYVKSTDLDKHECTRNCKRIVTTFVPEDYQLTFNKVDEWAKLDIAIVKVEVPFDRPSSGCMYNPKKIPINFDIKYENASVDVIMLGWGHSNKWAEIEDKRDYNQNTLRYASTKIFNKEDCKKYFTKPDLSMLIDKYMICTYGKSDMNDKGERSQRKYFSNSSDTLESFKEKYENTTKIYFTQSNDNDEYPLRIFNATRRQGICQNDHGGPLVIWINGVEHVIGVASVFRVNSQSECVPPFLFTSTARNKMFIECILGEEDDGRRSSVCDKPASERGFNILRTNVSWQDRHTRHILRDSELHEIEEAFSRFFSTSVLLLLWVLGLALACYLHSWISDKRDTGDMSKNAKMLKSLCKYNN